ncbi:TIGR00300 family protein [Methanoregula sp.]|jgi:lysine-ketoglutarate reductase/saccharopine dehydrogenase-like protein (TIGR00300 family)|uniref:ornithine cyclodeaminase n=1 Tax=Methanoregula sp. TaxID=2052170 RepID=UPI002639C2D6|nr:TIGR00300 family protein [Methanoregula sp.]MDD5143613.1 TIGR00300 family protein [Methanoregula sp.]
MAVIAEEIELKGHIIDSLILPRVLDTIMDMRGTFEILQLDVGRSKNDESYCRIQVRGPDRMFAELENLGALLPRKAVKTTPAPEDGVLPSGFYGTTHHPTFVFLKGRWREVRDIEMDCVVVISGVTAVCRRQGVVRKGDRIVVGFDGVRVEPPQRSRSPADIFGFMSSQVSPEKPIKYLIRDLALEMKKIHDRNGFIIHVMGTAMVHTGADEALQDLARMGYVQALFVGNGFAVMDVEKQLFGTTLGMDKKTGKVLKSGYKSHLVAINEITRAGGLRQAVRKGVLKSGVLYECVKKDIPFVIGGSLRDDGPLPDTITDVMRAQDEMRRHVRKADMCIICASMLHGIAVGNMLPSRVKTVAVDINPYVVTRLQDRGTTQALGLVTDPALLLPHLAAEIKSLEGITDRSSGKT